ncbi:MAG: response regulator, partial [Elusimicrobia bacterium]|nr:response regulator [Elusimicrobiota bacterium]
VVEDEPVILDLCSRWMHDKGGHDVLTASTPEQALELLEKYPIELAILDANLQNEKDGLHLCLDIKRRKSIPVLLLTAFANLITLPFVANNFNGAYAKPYHMRGILERVNELLDHHAQVPVHRPSPRRHPLHKKPTPHHRHPHKHSPR